MVVFYRPGYWRLRGNRASGQGNLFGGAPAEGNADSIAIELAGVPEWPENEKLVHEKEVLGLFISGHPLAKYEKEIRLFSSVSLAELSEELNGKNVSVVGLLTNVQIKRAQKSGMAHI